MDARKLLQLKDRVKKLDEQRIRAEANLEQAEARLKELGYDSIEDAEATLSEMKEAILEEEARLAEDVETLFEQYPDLR